MKAGRDPKTTTHVCYWSLPALLREIADDWEKTADEFERLEPVDHSEIRQYRWGAALLRGRARRMEIERFVE